MKAIRYKITNVKHYQSINTLIDGSSFVIPKKGESKCFSAVHIPQDIKQLIKDGIIKLEEI